MKVHLQNEEYSTTAVRCLQIMLRNEFYRGIFVEINGVGAIFALLCSREGFQVRYTYS